MKLMVIHNLRTKFGLIVAIGHTIDLKKYLDLCSNSSFTETFSCVCAYVQSLRSDKFVFR